MKREEEKVHGLASQIENWTKISDLPVGEVADLVRRIDQEDSIKHTLYLDKAGKFVPQTAEHEDRMELELKCRFDKERDWVYFNRYDAAIFLKGNDNPVLLSSNVQFINTYTPAELHKMVKNDCGINKRFYNSEKKESYESFAYIDYRNTDNEGYPLVRRKNIDLDKVIQNSNIIGKESPHIRAVIKDSWRDGEMAAVTIDINGEQKNALAKLKPQFNSANYFDVKDQKPIYIKGQGKSQEQKSDLKNAQKEENKKGRKKSAGKSVG